HLNIFTLLMTVNRLSLSISNASLRQNDYAISPTANNIKNHQNFICMSNPTNSRVFSTGFSGLCLDVIFKS
ncbi:hypothetical protein, partial [Citrobacter amalonaticus]|uniref:hypothetical protein n=1 Tax=Citrobacter amalonaticus TaxID=35703 RepID=UPI001E63D442